MTSIHHDIVFRNEKRTMNGRDATNDDPVPISNQQETGETTEAATHQAALAAGQFAFVEGEKNEDDEGHLPASAKPLRRRLLGNNLYSSFRKKSNNVDLKKLVPAEGIVFIPSHISLREGSLISDLHASSPQSSKSKKRNLIGSQSMDPRLLKVSDRQHEPATRPNRRSSLGSKAPEPPKLRELIQDSGILGEINMQKDGSMESILEERLSKSEWQQLSKKTQLAVSSAIESTLQEVLSLEDHPSFYSSAKSSSIGDFRKGKMTGVHSASSESSSTNEWQSFGDTTLSSLSMGGIHSQEGRRNQAQLQEQGASSEPDSDSARPLPHMTTNEQKYQMPTRQCEADQQERHVSPDDAIPTSRSLSISSRYEPAVSPIPDGVEMDVLPSEFDDSFLHSHRRDASDDAQNGDFLLTAEKQLGYLNRKDSTQSVMSEITMDTNVRTSGRSILTTPPATPMVLDPRAPQLLMAKLQSDPNTEIGVFPRPPMVLESPTPPMRKRSPDDDQVFQDAPTRTENTASSSMRPYARKGTLTQSAREQVHEMGAILENDEKAEASKAIEPAELSGNDGADSDIDSEDLSISESGDPAPISLRGPFANDNDTAPIQLGGLLRPQNDSNPLLFPAPLISDDEDEEQFVDDSELSKESLPSHRGRPKPAHNDFFSATTATPSIDNRRKGLSNVYVAAKDQKAGQYHRDIVFDSSNSSIDVEAETAPLGGASSSVGQFRQLNAKSTFRYPKAPSETTSLSPGPRMKEEIHAKSDSVGDDIDDSSSVESVDDPPPVSLRGPFADEDETAPLQLGNLLKPQDNVNPLLFPGPLLSSDDEDDGVLFEDESDAEAPPAPETTFVPPAPLDAPLNSSSGRQKLQSGDSNVRVSRAMGAKPASSSSSSKAFLSNVFDPSVGFGPNDSNKSIQAMGSVFDATKRSSFQNSSDDSNRDILFDASSGSIEFDPDDASSQTNGNEIQGDNIGADNGDETVLFQPPSKINSSVLADGQVDGKFCFKGGDLDGDGCVRVKLCPAQIGYLLDGKAHVHPGFYSGPLNSQCRMHGNGMFWFTSGDTYLGQFRNGELHGAGMMSVTDDETGKKQVFSGYFSHNKYVGDEFVDEDIS